MVGLRALQDADIEIFETELMNDVLTRVRSDARPWLHRLQLDTLTDNHAMIGAAERAGFATEGVLRQVGWVNGAFADAVVLSQLATEWRPSPR